MTNAEKKDMAILKNMVKKIADDSCCDRDVHASIDFAVENLQITNPNSKIITRVCIDIFDPLCSQCVADVAKSFDSYKGFYNNVDKLMQDIFYNSCLYFIYSLDEIIDKLFGKNTFRFRFRNLDVALELTKGKYEAFKNSSFPKIMKTIECMNNIELCADYTSRGKHVYDVGTYAINEISKCLQEYYYHLGMDLMG